MTLEGPPPGYDGPPPGIDSVTGALNMPAFAMAFARDVLPARLDETALWYIDVRNFRSVNPKFGFFKGNAVLKRLVECVRSVLIHSRPIARLGADRFVFVTDGLDYEEAQEKFAELIEAVNAAAVDEGVNMALALTGGLYYLGDIDYDSGNHNRAMDYASIAHRNARCETRSTLLMFTNEDLERDNRRITIEQTIDEALVKGQIEVWYQPQIDYVYGEVVGAEALARWHHPELGWVSPAEFIPVLENCGKVHELDLFVWEEACKNAGRWRNVSDGKPVPISVNVSRVEMFEDGLLEHFLELQEKYGLPNGSLRLEITESAFVEEAERLYGIIENMRNHDMLVEMDDFGNGLSSLNMLKDVPVDVVKLDMGFMQSAVNEDRGGVVLGSVIRMLQGLDTPIIAEGVETLEQAEMLKNMGCHLMQGFHFSRPMPLEDFESFIASNKAVEGTAKRTRDVADVDELTSFNPSSTYLFNNAIGATLFFYAGDHATESILVNDEFYEMCGLERSAFGDAKINPIEEIDEESRATLWRAAAEARELGAAPCRAKVRLTGRWIDCIMRYIGTNARGDVYSLNIFRWGQYDGNDHDNMLAELDNAWAMSLLAKIMPTGFFKSSLDDTLTLDYISPNLIKNSGLTREEFMRRYHNFFMEFVLAEDRHSLLAHVRAADESGALVEAPICVYYGYDETRDATLFGRIERDEDGVPWLYAFVALKDANEGISSNANGGLGRERIIPFNYFIDDDRLEVQVPQNGGSVREYVIENWSMMLDKMPDNIAQASAAKVLATIRDLRNHPISGFTDLKCNLSDGEALRWYHINYSCETDDAGKATIVRGYAQDANDQMGSAKWWRRQAEIDQLTGLLNRNAVEQEVNLAMRTQGVGMMFMIDLDGFKRVNDEMGHITGDSLLRAVANTLDSHFREDDVLGRYGGDEFVAFVSVAAGDPRVIAARRSKDIIDAIGSIEIPDGTHAACSVGVAISFNREATFYELLEIADQAMYQSKMAGKGMYTLFDMQ